MGGLINLLIYAVCSVFVTTHTTPVPVHLLERPPTNIVHGNQNACSLPMQDQQESMQFTPLNASAPPVRTWGRIERDIGTPGHWIGLSAGQWGSVSYGGANQCGCP